jgi:DNA-binding NarL/FixJ family response regulator
MVNRLLSKMAGDTEEKSESKSHVSLLSDRELTVFQLIGRGYSTSKIAEELHLSVKTVETHRAHIKEKMNLSDAADLARCAAQWMALQGQ